MATADVPACCRHFAFVGVVELAIAILDGHHPDCPEHGRRRGEYALVGDLLSEVERLHDEARRWYRADGSFEVLDSPQRVVERRKAAAKELADLRERADILATANEQLNEIIEQSSRTFSGFRALVAEMRELQREFFDRDRRKPDTVKRAKALEKRVDAALAPEPEPTLF
jgi:hypothetical protein